MACKFELHHSSSRYYFTLVGEDGTELLRGLPLFTKTHARKAAEAAQASLQDPAQVFQKESHGEFYFVLHDRKHEMVARSPHMHSKLAVDEILDEAREAAAKAVFLDVSEGKSKASTH